MKPAIDRHGIPPTVTCACGKVGYLCRRDAKHIARQLGHRGLSTYRCPDSGYWHLGHLPKRVIAGEMSRDEIRGGQ